MADRKRAWKRVKFGEVVRQIKEKADPETSGLTRFVAGEHMDTDDLRIRRWGDIGDGYLGPAFHARFRPGQVLYGSRRTYLRKVAVADFDGICANTTFVLESRDPEVLLPELLPFIMQTEAFHEHSKRESKGSVNPYVNFSDLAWYEFALPPLEEQRRIAEVLRATQGLHGAHEALLSAANAMVTSASREQMAAAVHGAPRVPLSNHCVRLPQSGIYKPAEFIGRGVRLVQMGELFGNDRVSSEVCKARLDLEPSELEKFGLAEGDLLFGRRSIVLSGAGRCVVVGKLNEPVAFESSIIRIRLDTKRLLPNFLFEWMRSPFGVSAMGQLVTFTTVAGIKGSDLARLPVPIPEMARQHAVSEVLRDLRKTADQCKARAESVASIFIRHVQRVALEV